MTKGYLLFALETEQVSYCRLAYACALTIKLTQPNGYNNVSVITNNRGYFNTDIFDNIIPSGMLSGMDARSRAYDLSPYDETVLLDSDMLFLQPMDHYWDLVSDLDLFIASCPQNYRRQRFHHGHYRKIFADNQWPDVYSAWTYFKKSKMAQEFFDQVKMITDYPEEFIDRLIPTSGLATIPTDEAFAMSLDILDIEDQVVFPQWDWPRITHMKPAVQQFKDVYVTDWNDKLRFLLNVHGQIKLGVWQQTDLLHYVKKELITHDVIKILEAAL
jgi:hypothetical protein